MSKFAEIKDFSQALGSADLACSIAKEQGRNRVHIYESTDEAMLKHENQMMWVNAKVLLQGSGWKEAKFTIYVNSDGELAAGYQVIGDQGKP